MQRIRRQLWLAALCGALGCNNEKRPEQQLAPPAAALSAVAKPASAQTLVVEPSTSRFAFLMDSPLEKIEGEAPQSLSGELSVDPEDVTKATALIKADLKQLTLYQQKRGDEKSGYGKRTKSDLQNEHARGWLELDPKEGEVTAEQAEANRFAELRISKLENPSVTDVTKLTGAERRVTAEVSGDFRLHGRVAPKRAKVELVFRYEGDSLRAVDVKTLEPFVVSLEEFEVHPRDAAGKIVKSLTDALSSNLKGKVAKDAPVTVSFSAKQK